MSMENGEYDFDGTPEKRVCLLTSVIVAAHTLVGNLHILFVYLSLNILFIYS